MDALVPSLSLSLSLWPYKYIPSRVCLVSVSGFGTQDNQSND